MKAQRIPVNLDDPDRIGVKRCENCRRRRVLYLVEFRIEPEGTMDFSELCAGCLRMFTTIALSDRDATKAAHIRA